MNICNSCTVSQLHKLSNQGIDAVSHDLLTEQCELQIVNFTTEYTIWNLFSVTAPAFTLKLACCLCTRKGVLRCCQNGNTKGSHTQLNPNSHSEPSKYATASFPTSFRLDNQFTPPPRYYPGSASKTSRENITLISMRFLPEETYNAIHSSTQH